MGISWTTILFILFLAFVPALGWLLLYRYLDNRDPEPGFSSVFGVFLGISSTLPVFAMQYLFNAYPQLDLISYLRGNLTTPLLFTSVFLLFVAFVEELMKGLAFIILFKKYERFFNQVVDGIFYAALIGIGFALAENAYYLAKAWLTFKYNGNFVAILSIRSFGTMLAHTLFTAVFGFYFAKAYFAPFITKGDKSETWWNNLGNSFASAIRLRATFFYLLPKYDEKEPTLRRDAMIIEGFLVAILLHFLYNAMIKMELFGNNWTALIIPFIFIITWYVWSRFFIKPYIRIIDFIKTKTDFYRVRIR